LHQDVILKLITFSFKFKTVLTIERKINSKILKIKSEQSSGSLQNLQFIKSSFYSFEI